MADTEAGYANSLAEEPAYKGVCSWKMGAAETARMSYDAGAIPLSLLLEAYLHTIDSLSFNRQGNDRETQYRAGIYWTDPADESVVQESLSALELRLEQAPYIEAAPLVNFFPAEAYHQDYLTRNPFGYCHVNLADAQLFVTEHGRNFASAAGEQTDRQMS